MSFNWNTRKVFVSYKYGDDNVRSLREWWETTTVRDYVDILERLLSIDNIYCGEHDGEDLSSLSESQIWDKLKDKIYPTSVTIVLISPNMKEQGKLDKSQWIPWELSYSLHEYTRSGRTSHTNGILAIVLPDRNGYYDYAIESQFVSPIKLRKEKMFNIIKKNLDNKRQYGISSCYAPFQEQSYIEVVRWNDIFGYMNSLDRLNDYIERAYQRSKNADSYDIHYDVNL